MAAIHLTFRSCADKLVQSTLSGMISEDRCTPPVKRRIRLLGVGASAEGAAEGARVENRIFQYVEQVPRYAKWRAVAIA